MNISERLESLPMTPMMRKILILVGIGWMFDAMDQGMVAGVLAAAGADWQLETIQQSILASAGTFGMILGAALSGVASDRWGRRTVILFTLLLYSFGSLLCGLAVNYTMLVVCRFITGFGLGGELPAASTLVSEFSPLEKRGRNVVLLESFWAWGWIIAALVAYLLTELADKDQVEEKAVRGKDIYNRMKKEHPFLTGNEDSVFAVLMAFSSRLDDELITDMEACYQALRARFSAGDALQTVSHVLSLADGSPVLKASRVIDLYNSLRDAGIKYGRSHELSVLAALSLTDAGIPELVEDIREVDAFLKTQKGFGTFGTGSQLRAMNAALVVSDQYTVRDRANTAAMTSTLAIIIAQQMAMCAVMASTAAATAASSN